MMKRTLILDGKVAASVKERMLRERIAGLSVPPSLAIVCVGGDERSLAYIRRKKKMAERIGVSVLVHEQSASATPREVKSLISQLNADPKITGIIVQLPLPKHLEPLDILSAVDPRKDADGLAPKNFVALISGKPNIIPATTRGVISLLKHYKIEIAGKRVAVLGRSMLVGKPTALALLAEDATVTICHSKTADLANIIRESDIVVSAIGKPRFLKADLFHAGQVVVDVGISASPADFLEEDGGSSKKLVGDVDFEEVSKIVAAISPVPGGVGPMTVISLFENLADLAESK